MRHIATVKATWHVTYFLSTYGPLWLITEASPTHRQCPLRRLEAWRYIKQMSIKHSDWTLIRRPCSINCGLDHAGQVSLSVRPRERSDSSETSDGSGLTCSRATLPTHSSCWLLKISLACSFAYWNICDLFTVVFGFNKELHSIKPSNTNTGSFWGDCV